MKKSELQKIIQEEIKSVLNEQSQKYTVNSDSYTLSVETQVDGDIGIIKQDGHVIATYTFSGGGVLNVKKADTKELINSLSGLIFSVGRKS